VEQQRSSARHRQLSLLALVVAAIAGCGGGGSDQYPANVRANYLKSCEANSPAKVCDCTLKWIEKHVSLSRFEAGDKKVRQGGRAPGWVYTAVKNCVHS
jgi:hypothetical protein